MTLANKLTIFRFILVVPFIALLTAFWYINKDNASHFSIKSKNIELLFITFAIFVIAMVTDFLDGYIARTTNTVSTFGKIADPIADKIMTNSALIALAVFNFLPFWVAIIFIARDITVDGVRNYYAAKKIDISASIYGKAKTFVQFIALVIIFFGMPFVWEASDLDTLETWYWILQIPLLIALALSLISGFLYLKPLLKNKLDKFKNKDS